MIQILKGNERKVADIAIERAPNSSSKPVRMPVACMAAAAAARSGGDFFDFIFGGQRSSPPRSIVRAAASVSIIMADIRIAKGRRFYDLRTPANSSPAFLYSGCVRNDKPEPPRCGDWSRDLRVSSEHS